MKKKTIRMNIPNVFVAILAVLTGIAMLSSCSSEKGKVEQVLSSYVNKRALSIGPTFTQSVNGQYVYSHRYWKETYNPEMALVKIGFLTAKIEHNSQLNYDNIVYAVTEKGMKYFNKKDLCFDYAHFKFIHLDNCDIDTDQNGGFPITTASCDFTYTIGDIPPWINDKSIQMAYPKIQQNIQKFSGNQKDSLTLKKQNGSWGFPMFFMFPKKI